MFPTGARYDFRRIGLAMFLLGALFMVIGTIQAWTVAVDATQRQVGVNETAYSFWLVVQALANPLMYNGVILYLLGRLMRSWSVSLVGFEHSTGDELTVRGPSDGRTVWIGRKYASILEAEAAAAALRQRFGEGKL